MKKRSAVLLISISIILMLNACASTQNSGNIHTVKYVVDEMESISDYRVDLGYEPDYSSKEESYLYLLKLCGESFQNDYGDDWNQGQRRLAAFRGAVKEWLEKTTFEDELFTKEEIWTIMGTNVGSDMIEHLGHFWVYGFGEHDCDIDDLDHIDHGLVCLVYNYNEYARTEEPLVQNLAFHILDTIIPGELVAGLDRLYDDNDKWKTEDGHKTYLKMERFQSIRAVAADPYFEGKNAELVAKTDKRLEDFTVTTGHSTKPSTGSHSGSTSGSTYSKDPYDADEYEDGEDFADDWEDDFDSWDDAYEYWEDYEN